MKHLDQFTATFLSQFALATSMLVLVFATAYSSYHWDVHHTDPGPQITVREQVVYNRDGADISNLYNDPNHQATGGTFDIRA